MYMFSKKSLLDIWDNWFCEGTNRKALRRVKRASALWHSGKRISKIRAVMMNNRNIRRFSCEIYPQAVLGEGLYIPHCVGITVGKTAVIGKHCIIFPNVVFGAEYSPARKNPSGRRHPKCGDYCIFGANSSIIGAITIGHHVTVGAGSVITKDIPDYAIVVGNNRVVGFKDRINDEKEL